MGYQKIGLNHRKNEERKKYPGRYSIVCIFAFVYNVLLDEFRLFGTTTRALTHMGA